MSFSVDSLWKAYPRWDPGPRRLESFLRGRVPFLMRRGEIRWALRDVSFAAGRGQAFGLVGGNGAGKSTLLRLAAGLGRPTRGTVKAPEGSASVLTLGDSFDLNLTGAENAATAAIVAGFSRRESRAAVARAVEFAELEEVVDAPVRTYSEGMKLRLAFGVVAQLRPSVLLVDEVLAVGDLRFQERCLRRAEEMLAAGSILVIASHDLDLIESICEQAIWLEAGAVRLAADAHSVVEAYRNAMMSATLARTPPARAEGSPALELRRNRFGSQEFTIENVELSPRGADPRLAHTVTGGPLGVAFSLLARSDTETRPVNLAVSIKRVRDGVKCCDEIRRLTPAELDGARARIELGYERLDLAAGEYSLEIGAYSTDWEYAYDLHMHTYRVDVGGDRGRDAIYVGHAQWRVTPAEGET